MKTCPAAKLPLAPKGGVSKKGARASSAAPLSSKAAPAQLRRKGKVTRSMAKGLSGIIVDQPVLGDATNTVGGPADGTIQGALTRARRCSVL